MQEADISIHNHIPPFLGLDDPSFERAVDALTDELSCGQPFAGLIRQAVDRALKPLAQGPDRQTHLSKLASYDVTLIARTTLAHLTPLLPPPLGRISCHVLPAGGTRGSGVCFAPDGLLAAAPCDGDVLTWLPFVIAHEYSHTTRGFGENEPVTVRDHLVFEGLAMVLAEMLFPLSVDPYPWQDPRPEQESAFWSEADLDAEGDEARARYISNDCAYAIGKRIIRHYLRRHAVSILEAHQTPNADLYWQSGYPLIR